MKDGINLAQNLETPQQKQALQVRELNDQRHDYWQKIERLGICSL